jgi:transcription elongation factor SPT6
MGQKYVPRIISHPKYKNIGLETAVSFLVTKDIGDLLFRPSSKGTDHLTCSWKFYDTIIAHIDIIEEGKPAPNMMGTNFLIRDESYESLQEIADRYVLKCAALVKEVVEHPKFLYDSVRGLDFVEADLMR